MIRNKKKTLNGKNSHSKEKKYHSYLILLLKHFIRKKLRKLGRAETFVQVCSQGQA